MLHTDRISGAAQVADAVLWRRASETHVSPPSPHEVTPLPSRTSIVASLATPLTFTRNEAVDVSP